MKGQRHDLRKVPLGQNIILRLLFHQVIPSRWRYWHHSIIGRDWGAPRKRRIRRNQQNRPKTRGLYFLRYPVHQKLQSPLNQTGPYRHPDSFRHLSQQARWPSSSRACTANEAALPWIWAHGFCLKNSLKDQKHVRNLHRWCWLILAFLHDFALPEIRTQERFLLHDGRIRHEVHGILCYFWRLGKKISIRGRWGRSESGPVTQHLEFLQSSRRLARHRQVGLQD